MAAGSSETTNENVDETQGVEPATVYGGAELDDFSASLDVRVKLSTMSSCCSTVKVNVKSEDDLAGGQEQPQSSQVQAASVSAPEILVEPPQTPPRTSEQTPEESEINGRIKLQTVLISFFVKIHGKEIFFLTAQYLTFYFKNIRFSSVKTF